VKFHIDYTYATFKRETSKYTTVIMSQCNRNRAAYFRRISGGFWQAEKSGGVYTFKRNNYSRRAGYDFLMGFLF